MGNRHHYISENVVDMHAAPDSKAEVVSQAIYGTLITLVKNEGTWIHIQTPDTRQGWIKNEEQISRASKYPATPHAAQVDAIGTHLYRTDDTTPHPPVITLPFDAAIEIVSDSNHFHHRWMRVRLLTEEVVWAQTADFRIDPKPLSFDEMIRLSHRFLGIPYRIQASRHCTEVFLLFHLPFFI